MMVAVCAPAPQSVVVSPRITVDSAPDYTDLGRFVAFYKDRGLAGQELAIALWQRLSGVSMSAEELQRADLGERR